MIVWFMRYFVYIHSISPIHGSENTQTHTYVCFLFEFSIYYALHYWTSLTSVDIGIVSEMSQAFLMYDSYCDENAKHGQKCVQLETSRPLS